MGAATVDRHPFNRPLWLLVVEGIGLTLIFGFLAYWLKTTA
jgi:hypothetical protein